MTRSTKTAAPRLGADIPSNESSDTAPAVEPVTIAFVAPERLRFTLTAEFESTADDPQGRGVIDIAVAQLKRQGLTVRNVALQVPVGQLMSPSMIRRQAASDARHAANVVRIGELRELSALSRQAVGVLSMRSASHRTTETPSPGSPPRPA